MGGASSSVPIRIPPRLDEKLGRSALGNNVRATLTHFHSWIGEPRLQLFLFPEYTDHGPEHVNRVLTSAEWLITEEAWPLLTEQDSAVMCLATLLHDAAMHLSGDGLVTLLNDSQRHRIDLFDKQSWAELFEEFFAEARRWDSRKLYRILGDRTRGPEEQRDLAAIVGGIHEKVQDPGRWDEGDRKLLGEFLRRHHARLAHEIALSGVPSSVPGAPDLSTIPDGLADLAGLVARSHNLALRGTFEYLQRRYSGRVTCLKTHPVFLMVLLRIADYLEMDAERVNETALKLYALRSPISQEEWDAHLSAREIRMPDEGDLEAAFIFAVPENSDTFLKLKHLLGGLQKELHASWAVLGEVFSRQEDLRRLGVRLRRVRSNLDDPQEFFRDQAPNFFPVHAAFDAVGTDLLKLLVKPLFGDRPEVGVRELLQNAVDSVRELEQLMTKRGDAEMKAICRPGQVADVLIDIDYGDDGSLCCTVNDKGIGMTAEIVQNYFLKAGASFHASDFWIQQFASDGVVQASRSGHFGMGVLAAFLLGDQIEVHTRHVDASPDDAVFVSAGLADRSVALERRRKLDVGTRVQVRLRNQAELVDFWLDSARWDWYCLTKPRVERKVRGEFLNQSRAIVRAADHPDSVVSDFLVVKGLEGIWWDYENWWDYSCNGITLKPADSFVSALPFEHNDLEAPLGFPRFDVVEGSRSVSLNLQRNRFEESSSFFLPDLLDDVRRDLCAFLLSLVPQSPGAVLQLNSVADNVGNRAMLKWVGETGPFWCLPEGFSLMHSWHLRSLQDRRLFVIDRQLPIEWRELRDLSAIGCVALSASISRTEYFLTSALPTSFSRRWSPFWMSRRLAGWRPKVDPQADGDVRAVKGSDVAGEAELPLRLVEVLSKAVRRMGPSNDSEWRGTILEVWQQGLRKAEATSSLSRVWTELIGDPIIPYDLVERRRACGRAFEVLRDRVERWSSVELAGWRRTMRDEVVSVAANLRE